MRVILSLVAVRNVASQHGVKCLMHGNFAVAAESQDFNLDLKNVWECNHLCNL